MYYDQKEEFILVGDASETKLMTRALVDADTRYAQIEKKLLGLVFDMERFHQYTFGRHVTVQSDHKIVTTPSFVILTDISS